MSSAPRRSDRRADHQDWCRCVYLEVARAVLWETTAARRALHRAAGTACGATLVVAGLELLRGLRVMAPAGTCAPCPDCGRTCQQPPTAEREAATHFRISGDCECAALLADVLDGALRYLDLRRAHVLDPAAAARRHVRVRQHDYIRVRRAQRGAQVRTDRLENGVFGRQLTTQEQRWLLRDIADEAGSSAPLDGDAALLSRLAVLRARRSGEDAATILPLVTSDFEVVRKTCSQGRRVNVGDTTYPEFVTWWEAYVERPLGRRQRSSNIPLDVVASDLDAHRSGETEWSRLAAADDVGARDPMLTLLAEHVRRAAAEVGKDSPAGVLALALHTMTRACPTHRIALENLAVDQQRNAMALAAITELLASEPHSNGQAIA
jgi:hypothetical protein